MIESKQILSKDEYRAFNYRVQTLQSKGYDLPFETSWNKDDDTYSVTIYGRHDFSELDRLTENEE